MDIALAIPGAGFDGIVPGTNSPQFAAIRLVKNFQRIYLAASGGYVSFFELGGP